MELGLRLAQVEGLPIEWLSASSCRVGIACGEEEPRTAKAAVASGHGSLPSHASLFHHEAEVFAFSSIDRALGRPIVVWITRSGPNGDGPELRAEIAAEDALRAAAAGCAAIQCTFFQTATAAEGQKARPPRGRVIVSLSASRPDSAAPRLGKRYRVALSDIRVQRASGLPGRIPWIRFGDGVSRLTGGDAELTATQVSTRVVSAATSTAGMLLDSPVEVEASLAYPDDDDRPRAFAPLVGAAIDLRPWMLAPEGANGEFGRTVLATLGSPLQECVQDARRRSDGTVELHLHRLPLTRALAPGASPPRDSGKTTLSATLRLWPESTPPPPREEAAAVDAAVCGVTGLGQPGQLRDLSVRVRWPRISTVRAAPELASVAASSTDSVRSAAAMPNAAPLPVRAGAAAVRLPLPPLPMDEQDRLPVQITVEKEGRAAGTALAPLGQLLAAVPDGGPTPGDDDCPVAAAWVLLRGRALRGADVASLAQMSPAQRRAASSSSVGTGGGEREEEEGSIDAPVALPAVVPALHAHEPPPLGPYALVRVSLAPYEGGKEERGGQASTEPETRSHEPLAQPELPAAEDRLADEAPPTEPTEQVTPPRHRPDPSRRQLDLPDSPGSEPAWTDAAGGRQWAPLQGVPGVLPAPARAVQGCDVPRQEGPGQLFVSVEEARFAPGGQPRPVALRIAVAPGQWTARTVFHSPGPAMAGAGSPTNASRRRTVRRVASRPMAVAWRQLFTAPLHVSLRQRSVARLTLALEYRGGDGGGDEGGSEPRSPLSQDGPGLPTAHLPLAWLALHAGQVADTWLPLHSGRPWDGAGENPSSAAAYVRVRAAFLFEPQPIQATEAAGKAGRHQPPAHAMQKLPTPERPRLSSRAHTQRGTRTISQQERKSPSRRVAETAIPRVPVFELESALSAVRRKGASLLQGSTGATGAPMGWLHIHLIAARLTRVEAAAPYSVQLALVGGEPGSSVGESRPQPIARGGREKEVSWNEHFALRVGPGADPASVSPLMQLVVRSAEGAVLCWSQLPLLTGAASQRHAADAWTPLLSAADGESKCGAVRIAMQLRSARAEDASAGRESAEDALCIRLGSLTGASPELLATAEAQGAVLTLDGTDGQVHTCGPRRGGEAASEETGTGRARWGEWLALTAPHRTVRAVEAGEDDGEGGSVGSASTAEAEEDGGSAGQLRVRVGTGPTAFTATVALPADVLDGARTVDCTVPVRGAGELHITVRRGPPPLPWTALDGGGAVPQPLSHARPGDIVPLSLSAQSARAGGVLLVEPAPPRSRRKRRAWGSSGASGDPPLLRVAIAAGDGGWECAVEEVVGGWLPDAAAAGGAALTVPAGGPVPQSLRVRSLGADGAATQELAVPVECTRDWATLQSDPALRVRFLPVSTPNAARSALRVSFTDPDAAVARCYGSACTLQVRLCVCEPAVRWSVARAGKVRRSSKAVVLVPGALSSGEEADGGSREEEDADEDGSIGSPGATASRPVQSRAAGRAQFALASRPRRGRPSAELVPVTPWSVLRPTRGGAKEAQVGWDAAVLRGAPHLQVWVLRAGKVVDRRAVPALSLVDAASPVAVAGEGKGSPALHLSASVTPPRGEGATSHASLCRSLERSLALKRLFYDIDQSGDGEVQLWELREAIKGNAACSSLLKEAAAAVGVSTGAGGKDGWLSAVFAAMDTDKSGNVSWPEFSAFTEAVRTAAEGDDNSVSALAAVVGRTGTGPATEPAAAMATQLTVREKERGRKGRSKAAKEQKEEEKEEKEEEEGSDGDDPFAGMGGGGDEAVAPGPEEPVPPHAGAPTAMTGHEAGPGLDAVRAARSAHAHEADLESMGASALRRLVGELRGESKRFRRRAAAAEERLSAGRGRWEKRRSKLVLRLEAAEAESRRLDEEAEASRVEVVRLTSERDDARATADRLRRENQRLKAAQKRQEETRRAVERAQQLEEALEAESQERQQAMLRARREWRAQCIRAVVVLQRAVRRRRRERARAERDKEREEQRGRAATAIQAASRGRVDRRHASALRDAAAAEEYERERGARVIQGRVRRYVAGRRDRMWRAVVALQSAARGFLVRSRRQREEQAAVEQRRGAEERQAEKEEEEEEEPVDATGMTEEEAATRIQAQVRGRRARRDFDHMLALDDELSSSAASSGSPSNGTEEGADEAAAAVKIQSHMRGHSTRRLLQEQEEAARKLQAAERGRQARAEYRGRAGEEEEEEGAREEEEAAATRIQAHVRGHRARRDFDRMLALDDELSSSAASSRLTGDSAEEAAAVVKIQSQVRGRSARRQLQEQEEAATKLQAAERGRQARSQGGGRADEEEEAATRIQAHVRGHRARRDFDRMLALDDELSSDEDLT